MFGSKPGKPSCEGDFRAFFNISASIIGVLSLAVIIVANLLVGMYSNSINAVMTISQAKEDETEMSDWKALAYNIAEEGMVLLENDNILPLTGVSKVNLLGFFAYNPIYSGTGSGFVNADDAVDVVTSLKNVGIEVNPAIEASGIYAPAEKTDDGSGLGMVQPDFALADPSVDVFKDDIAFDKLKEYSDTAIVVFGRRGAEMSDLPVGSLHITEDEEKLLAAAHNTFENVIVIINSANPLEMDWKKEYDVDAILWAGLPGPYGYMALGEILTGQVNPSGRLPEIWLYDHDSNPVNENFGEQAASNAEGRYYVDYVENVYLGYKWFETAYAEQAVITNTKTGETFDYKDYESIVVYPFGYGLSYTTFSQEITGGSLTKDMTLDPRGEYTVEVTVKNTGDVAGKCTAELYVTVPYTDYDKENLVEKPEVALTAFGKTGMLEPGQSETLTLNVSMEAIASYDRNADNGNGAKGTYMLDEGTYTFSLRSDSHALLESISANLTETVFFSGDNQRSSDHAVVENQFEEAARGEYLSRQDGFANYESAMKSVVDTVDNSYREMNNEYDPAFDEVVTQTYKKGVDYSAPGDLTLADMTGLAYDDPQWEALINQLSLEEMRALAGETMYSSVAFECIEKKATMDADGPLGLSSMFKSMVSVSFPCVPLLAATFNTDMAYRMGSAVADMAQLNEITRWYAPGMNLHRCAYGGRNYEYYSEDPVLSALMAAKEVLGARDKDIIVYIKHFVLNDQESQRKFVHTYSNEQAIREVYMKPFEYGVKYGLANGVMSSMNYIGDVYAGGHAGLLTSVLRDEWGFIGAVLTDMDNQALEIAHSYWTTMRAGVDFWLGFSGTDTTPRNDADIYYLRRAVHNQLYSHANSAVRPSTILDWPGQAKQIYMALALLSAVCVIGLLIRNVGTKKK